MVPEVFAIIKVNINIGLFSMVTELWVLFHCRQRPPANRATQVTLRDLEPAGTGSQAEAATRNSRCLQSSGSLICGRRWHFLKTASSTGHFKMKAIS
jgi:hypothetical protein